MQDQHTAAAAASTGHIACTIDLSAPGKQTGDLLLRHSDNRQPLGFYPVPIVCITGGEGPSALLTGGVHGDEFEGPVALMRLIHSLRPEDINGRVIIIPVLNAQGVEASSRVSPLDGANLNRAFPGSRDGGPTAMLARHTEENLIAESDMVIDLHAGGKASVFAPSALANRPEDKTLAAENLALAEAFGAPFIWLMGAYNDPRSVNAAAERQKKPMIAAELGGGGGCAPEHADLGEAGVRRCLAHAGILKSAPPASAAPARRIEVTSAENYLTAPAEGLFDRRFKAGDDVKAGASAGFIHHAARPDWAPEALTFPVSGVVLAHGARGYVERGEMLAVIAADAGAA